VKPTMKPLVLALTAALAAGCAQNNLVPVDDAAPTIASLEGRTVEVPADKGVVTSEPQTMAAYRAFLASTRDAGSRAEVMRRLADIEMDYADRKAADGGAVPDYKAALAQYEVILKEFPKAPGVERVLYQMARAQEQTGDLESALKTLTRLSTEFPNTAYRDEVHFRRGELLFTARQYAAAGDAYASVLGGSSLSPFAERSLYMRGWSLFKQNKLEDALEPFFKVLDLRLTRLSPGDDPLAHLSRSDRELLEDTHRVMSLALASLQGPASIGPFIRTEARRRYETQVYSELAELYLRQDRPKDAADALAFYARERPLETPAPLLLARVIDIHEKNGFPSLALQAKEDFVLRYGRESEFRRGNPAGWNAAQPRVKKHLIELAQHYHASAQQGKTKADLSQAVRWYRELLTAFSDDPEIANQRFLLAELLFEDKQWAQAAIEYETVAYRSAYPKAPDAGYSALLAYAEQTKVATGAPRTALQNESIASALRFAAAFPRDARVGGVTANAAEALLAQGQSARASQVARLTLAGPASADEQRTAWTVIGVAAFDGKEYAQAEQAYGEAISRAPAGSALASDLAGRRAAAVYKQAEAARDGGNTRDALAFFERVVASAPTPALRATAQFDAATAMLSLKEWAAATTSLEDFRTRYPGHALQADLPPKLALAYTEQKRWSQAAGEYERISNAQTDGTLRRVALWQATEFHGKAADEGGPRREAISAYERYAQAYAQPLDLATEARWRLVQLYKADGNATKQAVWTRSLRDAEVAGGEARTPRTRSLSALAALDLATPLLDAYRKVALVEPLAANLKLKKTRMEAVLKAYAEAAQDGAAEGVTAATFQTASLYQDFGKSMLRSQRPRRLTKPQLEQYNVLLEEQAFPFEEKAIGLYETNARRSGQGLYDEWVKKSFTALSTLKAGRWGKVERAEDALDAVGPAPLDEAVRTLRGGRLPDAERQLRAVITQDPRLAFAHANLGLTLRRSEKFDASAEALMEARRLMPGNIALHNQLGVTLRLLGRFDDARKAYEGALEIDPNHGVSTLNLAILHDLYLGEPAKAVELYARAATLIPAEATVINRWLAEVRSRKPQDGGLPAAAAAPAPAPTPAPAAPPAPTAAAPKPPAAAPAPATPATAAPTAPSRVRAAPVGTKKR
jgi:cellulose synthase operon protein C